MASLETSVDGLERSFRQIQHDLSCAAHRLDVAFDEASARDGAPHPLKIMRRLQALEERAGKVATRTKLTAFMRYTGQGYEIPVVLPQKAFSDKDIDEIQGAFDTAYTQLFGRTIEGLAVEITNWSLVVETALKNSELVEHRLNGPAANSARRRTFYDAEKRAMVSAQEVRRSEMSSGKTIDGPAVIVENETTTTVTSAFRAIGQEDGSLLLMRKEASQ